MSNHDTEQRLPEIPEARLATVGLVLTSLQLISLFALVAAAHNNLIKDVSAVMLLWSVLGMFSLCVCVSAAMKETDRRWIYLPLVSQAVLFSPFVLIVLTLKYAFS